MIIRDMEQRVYHNIWYKIIRRSPHYPYLDKTHNCLQQIFFKYFSDEINAINNILSSKFIKLKIYILITTLKSDKYNYKHYKNVYNYLKKKFVDLHYSLELTNKLTDLCKKYLQISFCIHNYFVILEKAIVYEISKISNITIKSKEHRGLKTYESL
jgi:hypothetical protein